MEKVLYYYAIIYILTCEERFITNYSDRGKMTLNDDNPYRVTGLRCSWYALNKCVCTWFIWVVNRYFTCRLYITANPIWCMPCVITISVFYLPLHLWTLIYKRKTFNLCTNLILFLFESTVSYQI